MIKCKKCESTVYVKSGHTRGYQRYLCKACGCQFTATKMRGVSPVLKQFSVVLYAHCGVTLSAIAKIMKVSTVAVLKWVRKYASTINLPQDNQSEIVQIDEMWHFVNGKKTRCGSGEPLMGYRVELSPGNWVVVTMQI